MALAGHYHVIEPFTCSNKLVGYPNAVARMNVIVDIAVNQQKVSLQVFGQVLVFGDFGFKYGFSFLFNRIFGKPGIFLLHFGSPFGALCILAFNGFCNLFHAVVRFAPPKVINVVVVVAG